MLQTVIFGNFHFITILVYSIYLYVLPLRVHDAPVSGSLLLSSITTPLTST